MTRLRLIRDTLPSMLVELSVVEQRYQAVVAVIRDGVSVVEVARVQPSVGAATSRR